MNKGHVTEGLRNKEHFTDLPISAGSTSVLMAATSDGDIGSGANSSGTKFSSIRRIKGSFNCGQTCATMPTISKFLVSDLAHAVHFPHIHMLATV
jgi:hypothetical protein